jgi:myo-inositol-1(or 4)-monophosphatase
VTAHQELLDLATGIAVEAGELALARRRAGVTVAATKSSVEDIVTEADRETELLIRSRVADARPQDGFLGEEGGASASTSGLNWVVDPIDGTVNYFYDRPAWSVSVALVEGEPATDGHSIVGVVVNPVTGEVYRASRGGGAWLGQQRLAVTRDVQLPLAMVATGFAYDARVRERQAGLLQGVVGRVRDIRRIGSAALELADVAAGRTDVYYENELSPWDVAAGALLVEEAGGRYAVHRDAGMPFITAGEDRLADAVRDLLLSLGQ